MKELKLIKDKYSENISISGKSKLFCETHDKNVFFKLTSITGKIEQDSIKKMKPVSEYNSLCFLTGEATATIKYKLE